VREGGEGSKGKGREKEVRGGERRTVEGRRRADPED